MKFILSNREIITKKLFQQVFLQSINIFSTFLQKFRVLNTTNQKRIFNFANQMQQKRIKKRNKNMSTRFKKNLVYIKCYKYKK